MFENVSKDLLEKAMQAKTKDEALAILKEGGVELTDEDLKNIAAGEEGDDSFCWGHVPKWLCPNDGSKCIKVCDAYCREFYCPGDF